MGQFYFFLREWGCVRMGGEPSPCRGKRLEGEEVFVECVIYCCWGVGPGEQRETSGISGGHELFGDPQVLWGVSG